MRKAVLPLIVGVLVLACAVGAWATSFEAPTTSGLCSVWITSHGQDAKGWYYNFELRDNTSNSSPLVDANGQQFAVVVDTLQFSLDTAFDGVCPGGWSWQGHDKFVKSVVQTGSPYIVPPSAGPGDMLGFTLYFDTEQDLNGFAYETHVYGVQPITGDITSPTTYSVPDDTIVLSDSMLYVLKPGTVSGNTWWDLAKGEDNNDPEREPTPPAVPEASSVFLGAMGLVGPAGYAFARRKKS